MDKNEPENITRLDYFFDMFDAVEEDISQLVSEENDDVKLIGGYECLFIALSTRSRFSDDFRALPQSPPEGSCVRATSWHRDPLSAGFLLLSASTP